MVKMSQVQERCEIRFGLLARLALTGYLSSIEQEPQWAMEDRDLWGCANGPVDARTVLSVFTKSSSWKIASFQVA